MTETPCRHLEPHLEPCGSCAKVYPNGCDQVLFVRTDSGYGIPIKDGGTSYIPISYCPFCGERLQVDREFVNEASREMFDRLMGICNPKRDG